MAINDIWLSDEREFESLFQKFVSNGGLDTLDNLSEDYERNFRKSACCEHGLRWKSCTTCHKEPKTYVSAYGYGA